MSINPYYYGQLFERDKYTNAKVGSTIEFNKSVAAGDVITLFSGFTETTTDIESINFANERDIVLNSFDGKIILRKMTETGYKILKLDNPIRIMYKGKIR